uniref:Ectonucleotide pyrophosphatase/phosphodiesterase family member 6 n=1 Tax=Ascaris lumbricoides TaxID=6252 RepID=A0A9J2PAJ0_ASCLU
MGKLSTLFTLVLLYCSATLQKVPYGQNLIVLLIDGLGSSQLNQSNFELLGFRHLRESGAHAEYVKPTYPTQSYPNWMSLFSGQNMRKQLQKKNAVLSTAAIDARTESLYAENHGFTADYMWDVKTGTGFHKGEQPNDTAHFWWSDRPAPLWYTAGKARVDVHCYWIAGCHVPYVDLIVQVPLSRKYNASFSEQTESLPTHFPEIVERITKYQAYKQQLYLIRYGGVESTLRLFGSQSHEGRQAISRADLYLHDLQQKLEERGLFESTNLVVISDHGLHPVDSEEQFYIEECLADFSKITKIVNSHSMMMVFTSPDELDEVFFELKVCDQWAPMGDYDDGDNPLVSVYRTSELPEKFHWKRSRFMPGIVIMTRPGATVLTRELPSIPVSDEHARDIRQTGGWDNDIPEMRGIFIARGPAFKRNQQSPPINMVDVYQVLLNILGIEPPHRHNGSWSNVEDLLSSGWESRTSPESISSSSSVTQAFFCLILLCFLYP